MANYTLTKKVIDDNIRRNGRRAITGPVLNAVLTQMLSTLGIGGYKLGGVVSPEDTFVPGDADMFFVATQPGTYADFGGFVLHEDEIGFLSFNGGWHASIVSLGGGSVDAYTKAESDEKFATNDALAAEISERQISHAEIYNDLGAEVSRAESAESAISARVDAIVQGKDVRDIVGSYAELEAYDTSTLGDNDIVMVLLDSTKSGHTTYYRWKQAEGEWEFIGGLAFTYTKTEIDDKFRALHIVLPSIPADAEARPENYQELLAQVDTMVRSAGADASFKMPIADVGNVDVTFVKTNPANVYLGVFADDRSYLYHIVRTISTPRSYTCAVIEKVFATTADLAQRVKVVDIHDEIWRGAGAQEMANIDGTPILVMQNGECFATIFPSTGNQYDWLWQDFNEGWGLTSVPVGYNMQNTWMELIGYLEANVSYLVDVNYLVEQLEAKTDKTYADAKFATKEELAGKVLLVEASDIVTLPAITDNALIMVWDDGHSAPLGRLLPVSQSTRCIYEYGEGWNVSDYENFEFSPTSTWEDFFRYLDDNAYPIVHAGDLSILEPKHFVATYREATYADVMSAIEAGKEVLVKFNDALFHLTHVQADKILFGGVYSFVLYNITIDNTDKWSASTASISRSITDYVGDKTLLATTDKSSLVGAINEVLDTIITTINTAI